MLGIALLVQRSSFLRKGSNRRKKVKLLLAMVLLSAGRKKPYSFLVAGVTFSNYQYIVCQINSFEIFIMLNNEESYISY